MAHLIDKDVLVSAIRKRLLLVIRDKHYDEWEEGQDSERQAILDIINALEVKEDGLTDRQTNWCPSKNQMESLHDMLKYNIGMFDYQKFMEVNSLYEDLTKICDYEMH